MEEVKDGIYVYNYPSYFVFDTSILPPEGSTDFEWDEESGYLNDEAGGSYFHRSTNTRYEFETLPEIPWPCTINELPKEYQDQNQHGMFKEAYGIFPTQLTSLHDEFQSVVKCLTQIEKTNGFTAGGKKYSLETFLDYHLNEYHDARQFLNFVHESAVKFLMPDSIIWLRIKNKIIKWHDERVKELDILLNPAANLESVPIEESELTPLEITAVAHRVILFHELGVIEPLKKLCMSKNPTLSDTQFADLLAGMMGFQGKQLETVRKALSGYGQRGKSDVKSRTALTKVKSELMKFGIEL